MKYEYHPASEIFPLIAGNDFTELCEDIKANGLRDPIRLFDGKIIDGRNRLRACEAVGVKPEFVTVTGIDPITYVVSLNLHRRHLTYDQRMGLALKIHKEIAKPTSGRPKITESVEPQKTKSNSANDINNGPKSAHYSEAPRSIEVAAKKVQVGKTEAKTMVAAEKRDPELSDKLIRGETRVRDVRNQLNRERLERNELSAAEEVARLPVIRFNKCFRNLFTLVSSVEEHGTFQTIFEGKGKFTPQEIKETAQQLRYIHREVGRWIVQFEKNYGGGR